MNDGKDGIRCVHKGKLMFMNVHLLHARECSPGICSLIVHDEYATTVHDKPTKKVHLKHVQRTSLIHI